MKEDLIIAGVVPNKTHAKEFPKIKNQDLFLAFFLGYYDGDGTEGEPVICSGNSYA